MQLYILGCGSAMPTTQHLPSSQVLSLGGRLYLIDCGEGVQRSFRQHKLNFNKIAAIFISHLHGDHLFGLPGLLSTLHLLKRTLPLSIVGPQGITDFVTYLQKNFLEECTYPIHVEERPSGSEEREVYQDSKILVRSFDLEHRVPTIGYWFQEKTMPRRINPSAVSFYQIPQVYYNRLQMGWDYTAPNGKAIPNSQLTHIGKTPRTYAYCSDTIYLPHLAQKVRGATLLFHESTFLESISHEMRLATGHSSAQEAAMVARDAGVERLIIGHYSSRWKETEPFLQEAQALFPSTIAATEGLIVEL